MHYEDRVSIFTDGIGWRDWSNVSKAVIDRFSKALGFKSWAEFDEAEKIDAIPDQPEEKDYEALFAEAMRCHREQFQIPEPTPEPTMFTGDFSPPDTHQKTDLIASITKLIDAATVQRQNSEYAAGRGSGEGIVAKHRIGAGYIGLECKRALAYKYHKVPETPQESSYTSPGELARHAQSGFWLESVFPIWLRDAGFDLRTVDPETGKQYGYTVCPDENGQMRLAGEIDGIFLAGPSILPYPCLWESKKMTDKKYNKFLKNGVKAESLKYYGQMQCNMAYLEVPYTLFSAMNLDTMKFYFELVPFDPAYAQKDQDAVAKIFSSRSPEEIPRVTTVESDRRCAYCPHKTQCWDRSIEAASKPTAAPPWAAPKSVKA